MSLVGFVRRVSKARKSFGAIVEALFSVRSTLNGYHCRRIRMLDHWCYVNRRPGVFEIFYDIWLVLELLCY